MHKTRNTILILIGAIVGVVIMERVQTLSKNSPSKKTNTDIASQNQISPPAVSDEKTGTIEGSMGFPSEIIPPEILVCAENQETKQEYCTNERIDDAKYTYHIGYKLTIPVGKYLAYEKMPGVDYRAYYSEFVTCGISVSCPSHMPIVIEVVEGQTTAQVDPQDWYYQPSPIP